MHYVTLPELRQNKFRMEWENDPFAKSAAPEMDVMEMEEMEMEEMDMEVTEQPVTAEPVELTAVVAD